MFFFCFFFAFFGGGGGGVPWVLGRSRHFFFNLGGGTPWVVTTSGLLKGNAGIQWDISKFGRTKPALSFIYNSSESNIQINI